MMRFDNIGGADVTLGGLDVCMRQTGSDSRIRFEVVVWTADGPGGAPGSELAHYAALADGVTATPSFHSTSFSYPLTAHTTVYLGVRYNPIVDPTFAFCTDLDGTTVHPAYFRYNETGAWADLSVAVPSNNALMFRAYVYTPGVFLESLLVPFYRVDTLTPGGTTTLYAVRNLTSGSVTADVEYFDVLGNSLRNDSISLGPNDTQTINVRDVAGLPAGIDGYASGYIEISTAGDPHQTPVLGGDFFQVDVAGNLATGDKLVRRSTDLCDEGSIRFLTFPFAGSGTRLTVGSPTPRVRVPVLRRRSTCRSSTRVGCHRGLPLESSPRAMRCSWMPRPSPRGSPSASCASTSATVTAAWSTPKRRPTGGSRSA